jgi:hypothetical protein
VERGLYGLTEAGRAALTRWPNGHPAPPGPAPGPAAELPR